MTADLRRALAASVALLGLTISFMPAHTTGRALLERRAASLA